MSDLPPITSSLPPRKRAKTQEEKEQRRIERILRNRRAAHASREKKRKHVEFLESSVNKLEHNINSYKSKESKLVDLVNKLLTKVKDLDVDLSSIDLSVLKEEPIPDIELKSINFDHSKNEPSNESDFGGDESMGLDDDQQIQAQNETILSTNPNSISNNKAKKSSLRKKKSASTTSVPTLNTTTISTNTHGQGSNSIQMSPLSTPIIKTEISSPFKSASEQTISTMVSSPDYIGTSTLDITSSNEYFSSASSSISGESRSSPISISRTDSDHPNGVDEYLSNINNPLFFQTDNFEKSELSNFFTHNQESKIENKILGDPFDDDNVNSSSRLHNPAAVFYDYSF